MSLITYGHNPEAPENIRRQVDYFEPHHSDLFSLELTLFHRLTEYLIHNFRSSHNTVSQQWADFLQGKYAEA